MNFARRLIASKLALIGYSMPRQDSLNEQMADVMNAAVKMGCYDAHDWLLRNFDMNEERAIDEVRRKPWDDPSLERGHMGV
jgi:hypothetical protein